MDTQPKYIPPHRRGLTPDAPNKFEKFLKNWRNPTEKATTSWGQRGYRKGILDPQILTQTEALLNQQRSEQVDLVNFENIPIEVSEQMPQMHKFADIAVSDYLLDNIQKMGYITPTPVQKHAIPITILRRDLMACAQTGSGKTAAFIFPMIAKMLDDGPPRFTQGRTAAPVGLVLAPTRELSIQIYEEALKFSYKTGIKVVVVYGGADPKIQSRILDKGADIVVATPGRLIDFLNRGKINLDSVKYVVLDEADRMLDMGFQPQIRNILQRVPEQHRQTVMCSATFPQQIVALASQFLKNYVFLAIGRVGSTTQSITQTMFRVQQHQKTSFLLQTLEDLDGLILVFVQTKKTADFLAERLSNAGYPASCIHGDRSQPERIRALNDFKSHKTKILVATDVASRGLDIPDVSIVINYDTPNNIDDYIHRIGRTGRIGKQGRTYAFINEKNSPILKDLYSLLIENQQRVPDWFESMFKMQENTIRRHKGRRYRNSYYYQS